MFKPALRTVLCGLCMSFTQWGHAAVVSLDFDSAATGLLLASSPLTTAAGTITLSGSGNVLTIANNTRPSNGILHQQSADTDRAVLSFDFDVASITFDFAGEGTGNFLAEALDIGGNIIDSFSFTGTVCTPGAACFDGVNILLEATGIRTFRFGDAPAGGSVSFVDNVRLSAVPEPGTLALLGLGLTGLAASRRRKQ